MKKIILLLKWNKMFWTISKDFILSYSLISLPHEWGCYYVSNFYSNFPPISFGGSCLKDPPPRFHQKHSPPKWPIYTDMFTYSESILSNKLNARINFYPFWWEYWHIYIVSSTKLEFKWITLRGNENYLSLSVVQGF